MAGLKWAPERLPIEERMMRIAVTPMEAPINSRRKTGSGSIF